MEYRFLGRTGMRVSAVCMGCMTFEPGMVDEKTAHRMLDLYVDAGGNFFDMADNYPGVEEVFGRWLKTRGDRSRFVIASKVRFPVGPGPNEVGLTRKHIMDSIESSLRKIQTDYLDLYQAHCWDQITPIEETLRVFDNLVVSGKIRYIGCSNFTGWQIMKSTCISEFNKWSRFESVQAQYNLMTRYLEWEILPVCREHGISVNAWSPLAAGWLTGKYRKDSPPPAESRMARAAGTQEEWERVIKGGLDRQIPHPTKVKSEHEFREHVQKMEMEQKWNILDAVGDVAKAHGRTNAQVALAWLLSRPGVCSVVIGASSPVQLEENLGCTGWELSKEETDWLDKVSDPGLPYPHDFLQRYGQWR